MHNGQLTIPGLRSKACCCATLAMSQGSLCERPFSDILFFTAFGLRDHPNGRQKHLLPETWAVLIGSIKGGIIAIWQD